MMTSLLVFRERLKKQYLEYSRLVDAALRFALAFVVFTVLNMRTGYMENLTSMGIVVGLALVCSVLPAGMIFTFSCVLIFAHLSVPSITLAGTFAVACLLMYMVYFSFKPGNAHIAAIALLLTLWELYAPIPMIVGLLASPVAVIPALFGLAAGMFVEYIDVNYAMLVSSDASANVLKQTISMVRGVITQERFWGVAFIILVVAVAVYVLRRTFFKSNWMVAIVTGAVLYLMIALTLALGWELEFEGVAILTNIVLTLLVGLVLHFFCFMVDASREEHVQFEDEEYYYYVKVVPKIRVTAPEVRITKINSRKVKEEIKTSEQVVFVDAASASKDEEE